MPSPATSGGSQGRSGVRCASGRDLGDVFRRRGVRRGSGHGRGRRRRRKHRSHGGSHRGTARQRRQGERRGEEGGRRVRREHEEAMVSPLRSRARGARAVAGLLMLVVLPECVRDRRLVGARCSPRYAATIPAQRSPLRVRHSRSTSGSAALPRPPGTSRSQSAPARGEARGHGLPVKAEAPLCDGSGKRQRLQRPLHAAPSESDDRARGHRELV